MSEDGFPLISSWPDEPAYHICRFNSSYLSEVLGAVSWYDDPDMWQGTPEEQDGMRSRIWVLMEQINTPYTPPAGGDMLIGAIVWYPGSSVPSGWLACDGDAYSRSAYDDLYSVIGETFGVGDGTTTFNVPDLQSRVVVGVGQGDGLTDYALADEGGAEAHALTEDEMPEHSHNFQSGSTTGTAMRPARGSAPNAKTLTTLTSGSGAAHENRQPYIALRPIIYAGGE